MCLSPRLERIGEEKSIFVDISLNTTGLSSTDDSVQTTVIMLYRRLLSRDPTADEVATIATLADPFGDVVELQGYDVAKMICVAVGAQMEFVLQ